MNETIQWINNINKNDPCKIVIATEIMEYKIKQGIYGIFIKERDKKDRYCAYIGRSYNIYKRMFSGKRAHFVKLKKGTLGNMQICEALEDENKIIEVRVVEIVDFSKVKNEGLTEIQRYNKEMQYMASRESFYIDYYQSKNQALEQRPDGSNEKFKIWKESLEERNGNV